MLEVLRQQHRTILWEGNKRNKQNPERNIMKTYTPRQARSTYHTHRENIMYVSLDKILAQELKCNAIVLQKQKRKTRIILNGT